MCTGPEFNTQCCRWEILLHGPAKRAALKMTERRQDCLEETDVFPYVFNTSYNFLAVTLFPFLESLGTLLCNLFQISKWKIKGKWTMIKQFKDYVTKGRTQNLKQVSTIKPPNPQQTANTTKQGQVLWQNQFFERNHSSWNQGYISVLAQKGENSPPLKA